MSRRLRNAVAAGACTVSLAAALGACSSVSTSPSQAALHYKAGPMSAQVFKNCVVGSQLQYDGPADRHYYYPAGLRTFKFSNDDGSDAPPLQTTSSDGQTLDVSGTITFELNTSCVPFDDVQLDGKGKPVIDPKTGKPIVLKHWPGGPLQKFHETIATQDQAYSEDDSVEPGDGWRKVLGKYLKDTTDRTVDNEALKYGWSALYNDPVTKAKWEQDVVTQIPSLIHNQTGGDFFLIRNIILQKPQISGGLQGELLNKQAAELRAQTAETDKAAALKFPGGIQAYLEYQRKLANIKGDQEVKSATAEAIKNGNVKVIPVPQGSDVIVNPGG